MSIQLNQYNYKGYHLKGVGLIEIGRSEDNNEKIKQGIEFLSTCKIACVY